MLKKKMLSVISLTLFAANILIAQTPKEMTYQGVLTDNNGTPLSGSYQLTLKIYDAATDGSLLWAEIHNDVNITDGLFRIILGSVDVANNPLNLPFNIQYWIGVQVESDPELTPRMKLTSVGYSFNSLRADSASNISANVVATANIQDGAITQAKLDSSVSFPLHLSQRLSGDGSVSNPIDIDQQGAIPGQSLKWNGSRWTPANDQVGGNTLDGAYDQNGAGGGRIITADAGPVEIVGQGGLSVFGMLNANNLNVDSTINTSDLSVSGTVNTDLNVNGNVTANHFSGDGSQLRNVKPLANYNGGYSRFQLTYNYGNYHNIKQVTLTVPGPGIVITMATGIADWESRNWDLALLSILSSHEGDPNSSWSAENRWWDHAIYVTDYNCTDSSDQYTSFSVSRGITLNSAGTYNFILWGNKYTSSAITELRNTNISAMYFPTGSYSDAIKQEEEAPINIRSQRSLSGD